MTRACRLKSAWLWIVVSLCLRGSCVPEVNAEVEQLTFCGSSSSSSSAESKSESKSTQDAKHQRSLIFVSTLDGKISALDAASDGKMQWMQDFNEGPMVSSNIHSRELSNNGQWVRLIPSLNGGLYKFDGENLENVPVSTEQLLRSSFRYSDDLVFSGGKETRSYGLSSTTGNILYECNIAGCKNKTDGDSYLEKEVLVVQRFQQTVRAVDPRTGFERWNFSVGQHEVVLIPGSNDGCHEKTAYTALDIELKVVIPEGLIWAISKTNPDVKLWQYKFDSPIVTIWREDTNAGESADSRRLKEISLFEDTPWEWGSEGAVSPGIYLGMHERQLYIQENKKIFKTLEYSSESTMGRRHKFPWRPHSASSISNEVATTPPTNSQAVSDKAMIQEIDEVQSTTALSVLYNSEYINGNGFYLYSREQLLLDNKQQCNSSGSDNVIVLKGNKSPSFFDDDEDNDAFRDDTPVQVIIVSLWYWWKEVLIISITTAILLNFMLTQRLLNATTPAKDAVLPPVIVESHVEVQRKSSESQDDSNNPANFKSRYLTDFEPIHCLGRGGYGVVFEAKNKIDDCNYAIKRIALPNSKDSRDRVMREVKALAKLDHYNIVRYFNAWLECPPVGWQEEHDEMWKLKQDFSLPETISEFSLNNTKCNNSICIDVPQSDQESSIESALEAYELNNRNRDVEDDSYIVFDFSEKGKNCQENIDITNCTDFSKSNGANGLPVSRDSSNDSESVIFQDDSSLSSDHSNHVIGRSRNSGKTPTTLSVKQTNKNSPKMFLYIQMQLCQRLSLREWLKHQITPRDPNRVLNIFQQIVEAVEYVHLQGLIHRDLKPSNIFFALDDKIKIGDFGLVTAMTEGYNEASTPGAENEERTMKASLHTARVGTHLYMSPEQMNGQAYNYKVDIYSLGIIFFELLTPFATDMERIMTLMDLKKAVFPKNFDVNYPSEYGLLKLMLDEDPQKRPTTLGIKARPPLSDREMVNGFAANGRNGVQWHFELPQISPHSSVTSTSSSESWESISNARSSL